MGSHDDERDNEFETLCPFCRGTGGPECKGDPYRCPNCKGAGFVPTDLGRKVVDLMQHNFRRMQEDARTR